MPLSVLLSDGDPSDAFHDQFSTIIRLESRLQGDRSEDVTGPARQRWVVRHLTEVARAQGFASLPAQVTTSNFIYAPESITPAPAQASTLNVHAQEFITPPPAQATTFGRSEQFTPWYYNFNLADQGVYLNSSGLQPPFAPSNNLSRPPSPYNPFNPAELVGYRAAVREQLLPGSSQRAASQHSASSTRFNPNPDSLLHPSQNFQRARLPSTPPNNFPRVRYPSTPPNRPPRYPHQTSPTDSLPDLVANTAPRSNTEPIAQSAGMGSLTAPDHYKLFEIYALEVKIGDYIQSVKNPGEVMGHYPCELDDQPIGENEARPVNINGCLRIQFKGADGTIRTKVFDGLDKVQVLREVANDDGEKEVKKEAQ